MAEEQGPEYQAGPVRGPVDLVKYLSWWAGEAQEVLIVILLDARMRIIGHKEVGRGGTSSCPINKQEVLRAALMGGATCIILAHNHPSGDPTPSQDDKDATMAIKQACEVIDIPLLDHLVIALDGEGQTIHRSLREIGAC